MKRLTCEACGSEDMVKQDGMFVCQYCGARYSVEEVKKMMVEGTVAIDNSNLVQNALQNARRAKEKEDWDECEKYYNLVEQHDPKNIEAIFYSAYGKTKATMVEADKYKKEQSIKTLAKSVSIVDDNYDPAPEKQEENKKIITQMNVDLLALMCGNFVYTQTSHTTNGITTYTNDAYYTHGNFYQLSIAWIETLQNIIRLLEDPDDTIYLWKLIRSQYDYQLRSGKSRGFKREDRDYLVQEISEIDEKISQLDSDYQAGYIPEVKIDSVGARVGKFFLICIVFCVILALIFFALAVLSGM